MTGRTETVELQEFWGFGRRNFGRPPVWIARLIDIAESFGGAAFFLKKKAQIHPLGLLTFVGLRFTEECNREQLLRHPSFEWSY